MIVDYDQEIEKFKKKFTAAGKPKEYVGHKKKVRVFVQEYGIIITRHSHVSKNIILLK